MELTLQIIGCLILAIAVLTNYVDISLASGLISGESDEKVETPVSPKKATVKRKLVRSYYRTVAA
jgi:hypothetical protein